MLSSWLPTMPSVDDEEDSVVLDFPLRQMLQEMNLQIENHTSALSDGNDISDVSEDDELQDEIDKLPSSERLVSQAISEYERRISSLTTKDKPQRMTEPRRRKIYSNPSPMNSVRTEVTKGEDRFAVQKRVTAAKQETKGWERGRNTPVSSPYIRGVDKRVYTRDVRESPGRSQPSDEKSNGIDAVADREPPEEILFVDDQMQISSTDLSENGFVPELERKTSLRYRASIDELDYVEERQPEKDDAALSFEKEMEFAALSERGVQESRQMSDLEKGKRDVFEEEGFWEDGFWKTPQTGFAEVPRETLHKTEVSVNKKRARERPSRQDIITALSLPTLEQQRAKVNAFKAEVEYGSHQEQEIDDESFDRVEYADVEEANVQSEESIVTETTPSWIAPWISPISPKLNETRFPSRVQSKAKTRTYSILHTSLQSEVKVTSALEDVSSQNRVASYNLRDIAVMIHILLTIAGGAVAIVFLR